MIRLLSFTNLLSFILLWFEPMFFMVLLAVSTINLGIHYWNKKNLYQYIGSIPYLLKVNNIAQILYRDSNLQEINVFLSKSTKIINQVQNRMSFLNLETKLQSDAGALFWTLLESIKTIFLLEPLLLFGVLNRLDTKLKEIEEVYSFVGHVDSLISIASLRKGLKVYCTPQIEKTKSGIECVELYHPLIADCITNSINVDNKSILLTGSNMSGKTSFIRTIGLNVICGMTLNTCFAKSFAMPRVQIYSAIRISDDLMNDKSYYFEEVLTIKKMIQQSKNDSQNLFLLDEIYKGTNTIERISAGKAVLSELANNSNIVFVSTHDIELADMLSDEYELYHFSEIMDHTTVDFDYKIKEGKLKNRNAIRILQINGYPSHVVDEAIKISKELDKISITQQLQNEI